MMEEGYRLVAKSPYWEVVLAPSGALIYHDLLTDEVVEVDDETYDTFLA